MRRLGQFALSYNDEQDNVFIVRQHRAVETQVLTIHPSLLGGTNLVVSVDSTVLRMAGGSHRLNRLYVPRVGPFPFRLLMPNPAAPGHTLFVIRIPEDMTRQQVDAVIKHIARAMRAA